MVRHGAIFSIRAGGGGEVGNVVSAYKQYLTVYVINCYCFCYSFLILTCSPIFSIVFRKDRFMLH